MWVPVAVSLQTAIPFFTFSAVEASCVMRFTNRQSSSSSSGYEKVRVRNVRHPKFSYLYLPICDTNLTLSSVVVNQAFVGRFRDCSTSDTFPIACSLTGTLRMDVAISAGRWLTIIKRQNNCISNATRSAQSLHSLELSLEAWRIDRNLCDSLGDRKQRQRRNGVETFVIEL